MKKLLLILSLLSSTAISVEVTTDNLLTNSTFGTGTTYSDSSWTIDEHTHGHHGTGSFSTVGGGNNPGGSVAAEENTSIEQTISSLSTAADMTVPEIQKGWSSTLSSDVWFWNQYNNTLTLKQTITDSAGNVTTQQRIIENTGCGSINCGQFTNYTDKHIQGANSSTDFSIKVGVHNTNNRSGHWGPDIDDVELNVTYTDVPPIDTSVQEELDTIEDDWTFDDVDYDNYVDTEFEEQFTFEEEFVWEEEEIYFEEFETVWEDYTMEFDDTMYFDMEMEEEFVEFEEFEEMDMPMMLEEFEEFETVIMPEDSFEEMYFEEFEEFETIEDAFTMEPEYEMTEMDTFFSEMTDEEWEELDTMSDDEFEEFLEEEFPEKFTEIREEMSMNEPEMEESVDMEVEEDNTITSDSEMEPEMEMEEEAEEMEVVNNDEEPTEKTTETMEEEPEPEESPQKVASDENKADGEKSIESESIEDEKKTVKVTKEKINTVKAKLQTKIKEIKLDEIKVGEIKPTLFSDQPNLDTYSQVSFYAPESLNYEVNDSFFDQVNLDMYNKQIYTNVSLSGYIQNDPVEVHRKKMEEITIKKRTLMIELQQLKGQQ